MQGTSDIYERITNQIIAAIEAGTSTFRMPWHRTGAAEFLPINVVTKRAYRGANVLALWAAADSHGYPTGHWATYRQWSDIGAQVRKGEHSTLVVFWKFVDGKEELEREETEQGGNKRFALARGYSVFNAAQVDGYKPKELPPSDKKQRIENAERFFAALGADVRHGGNRAFYSPSTDHIQLPVFEAFKDPASYYAVRGHESVHFTGAPHRLARDMQPRFNTEAYAAEELVAELGAAFLCSELGISNQPRPSHAQYVASWLSALRNDKRAIFTAASKAQEAVHWMQSKQVDQLKSAA